MQQQQGESFNWPQLLYTSKRGLVFLLNETAFHMDMEAFLMHACTSLV